MTLYNYFLHVMRKKVIADLHTYQNKNKLLRQSIKLYGETTQVEHFAVRSTQTTFPVTRRPDHDNVQNLDIKTLAKGCIVIPWK